MGYKVGRTVLMFFAICVAEGIWNYWKISEWKQLAATAGMGGQEAGSTFSGVMQMDIINTGIAMIAIAVSIWIGLNIYNNCKESELEKKLEKENRELAKTRLKSLFMLELRNPGRSHENFSYIMCYDGSIRYRPHRRDCIQKGFGGDIVPA